ncbi:MULTISPECIES: hypothetical protein [Pseudomonas]|uniref:Uncharacterized protein n=1 Tax=Pseudomonas cucumis TaxID=2954082 RepID=A0ABY9F1Y4_9PSED|nr:MULTISPECIES: hypothetical protein [Pseudomonas]WLG86136.1 hypothetical protein PSH97_06320 [Pseudomonas cucumis]
MLERIAVLAGSAVMLLGSIAGTSIALLAVGALLCVVFAPGRRTT